MNNLRPGKTIELMTRPGSNDTSAIISLITVSPLLCSLGGLTLDISIICHGWAGAVTSGGDYTWGIDLYLYNPSAHYMSFVTVWLCL